MIEPLLEAWSLKALPRAGWGLQGIEGAETVASHSWGIAMLVLAFLPPQLDRDRALSYATLHDLAEVRTGDITPHDGVSREQKRAAERAAMSALMTTFPRGSALLTLWEQYEAQADDEARFVRQLDRLDMALQAVLYARQTGVDTHEFIVSAERVVRHPVLLPMMHAIRAASSSRDPR